MTDDRLPYYHSTIEELLIDNRCPPCVYGEESKITYLRWFDIEDHHNPEAMLLISKNGLCREHGWGISFLGNKLSVLNQFVAKSKLSELEKIKAVLLKPQSGWLGKVWPFSIIFSKQSIHSFYDILKTMSIAPKCSICETIAQEEEIALTYMGNFLRREKGQKIYRESPSLCWRHLTGLLNEISSLELIHFLIKIHIEQQQKLDHDFEEYFRKTDYRYSKEPKEKEQLAWLKGLRFYVGEKLK